MGAQVLAKVRNCSLFQGILEPIQLLMEAFTLGIKLRFGM
jgi:hypothetical protein